MKSKHDINQEWKQFFAIKQDVEKIKALDDVHILKHEVTTRAFTKTSQILAIKA